MTFTILKYGRFFAIYEDKELLCITVYRKGARAVIDRIFKEHQKGEDLRKIPAAEVSDAGR